MSAIMKELTDVTEVVSGRTGIDVKELMGGSRARRVARARMMAMYVARQHTDATLEEIGAFFSRDHSTVVYAINAVMNDLPTKKQADAIKMNGGGDKALEALKKIAGAKCKKCSPVAKDALSELSK